MGYDNVSFGGVPLFVTSMTPVKKQKTVKQVVGKTLTEMNVVGVNGQQWELRINGVITGTTSALLDTNRDNLQALDDAATHAYVDGIHDGTFFIVPGSLQFSDSQDDVGGIYRYNCELVEE